MNSFSVTPTLVTYCDLYTGGVLPTAGKIHSERSEAGAKRGRNRLPDETRKLLRSAADSRVGQLCSHRFCAFVAHLFRELLHLPIVRNPRDLRPIVFYPERCGPVLHIISAEFAGLSLGNSRFFVFEKRA